jgi:hypothetical protein
MTQPPTGAVEPTRPAPDEDRAGEAKVVRVLRGPEAKREATAAVDAEDVVAALLGDPVSVEAALVRAGEGGLPAAPGFYAWWAAEGAIAGAPHHPHPRLPELGLLYVGISPARPSSRGTIRSRVAGQHVRGNTSSSTFRFVLASLLLEELALTPRGTASKVALDPGDNARLSASTVVPPKSMLTIPSISPRSANR